MLQISNLSKYYGDQTLFENISFFITSGDRSAIIGNNGAGKSTILKIITDEIKADSGKVFLEQGKTIGYLPQNAEFESNLDLLHSIICINDDITLALEELISLKNKNLSDNSLAGEYVEANANFEHYNGYNLLERAKIILKMLGFSEEEFKQDTKTLSGGQKTRALLGKLLLSDCDLLILDEPTNHLDYEAQELFVNYLNNEFKGAILIVSHDRYFLNQIVTRIYDLTNGSLIEYNGNYDKYLLTKKENEISLENSIEKNNKLIAKMEQSVQTLFSHRNFSARDSMQKKLDRIKEINENYTKTINSSKMKIKLDTESQSGTTVLKFDNLCKSFNNKLLFDNVNISVERGQKIGIVGPNGSGKSTFIKIINGLREADSGTLTYGHNVNMAYFAQEFEQFDEKKSLIDELLYNTSLTSQETRELLAKFVFIGDDIYKTIESLSGGEKCRLALAKIMANKPNLILLDEPTNHLDITSCEILEDAIKSYNGTIIIVSHDRYFLDKTTNITIEIKNGKFTKYFGNYTYYKEKSLEKNNIISNKISNEPIKEKVLNNRDIRLLLKPLNEKIKLIEKDISLTEEKIKELSELLGSEDVYKDGSAKDITNEYNHSEEKLNELMESWEKIQVEIDNYNSMLK